MSPIDGPLVLGHPQALYEHAVIHLLVTVAGKKWTLLFAFVELLPREIPPPLHDGVIEGPRLKKTNRRIYADHVPISAARALAWYDDARAGLVVRPEPDGSLPAAADPKATLCEGLGWGDEPRWPGYVCATSSHGLPFLSRWHETPRVHHLMPTASAWDFSPEEAVIVDDFLEEQFGFRRSAWTQLAGSVHLVAPNPYFRSVDQRLSNVVGAESITLAIEPRTQVEAAQFRAHLVEHRPTGIGAIATIEIDSSPRASATTPVFHETSLRIEHLSGGTLHVSERAPFMRQFHVVMDVSSATRRVQVHDGNGNALETYDVSVAHPNIMQGGVAASASATEALTAMMNDVEVRATAERLEQHWFAGDPTAAREFVRSRIRMAREQVLIADPFLGGVEVQRYALAVGLAGVPVRLLTTADGFNSVLTPAWLISSIAKWRATENTLGNIDVRVMTRDELHDRFLRVDNRLYTLGNSLNSLGERASLLMRVPDPTPVFAELERLWANAEQLADFAARWK